MYPLLHRPGPNDHTTRCAEGPMHRLLRSCATWLGFAVAQSAFLTEADARQYTLTPIPIGDNDTVIPDDVNNSAQVAGHRARSAVPQLPWDGFVWSADSGLTDLGPGLLPVAICSQGSVVGR